ncbi:MAG TPA: TetR/AcrR family transcriptional regulator [Thermodesulfobacteriota bacterium]|nr:TetR/AcrR family transcriptional regulator [Thermodesulfobacteriota bacterium]
MEIVKAAVELFVRKGFHRTTVREIAQKFGMSIGTLYEYIRTKEDILYLVIDYIHSSVSKRVRPSLKINGTSRERLENAIRSYYAIIDEMQDYVLFLYQETKSLSYNARKYIFKSEEEMTSIFEEIILQGIEDGTFSISKKDVNLLANEIMVTGQMWAFRRWIVQKNYTLERFIELKSCLVIKELGLS